jgi:hypothetical protein
MDARQSRAPIYDVTIYGLEDRTKLAENGWDVIVDPFVLRVGQFFLEGADTGPQRWTAIENDLGALVSFFDLVVLRNQIPAFNYPDTFDRPDISQTLEFRDRLGDVVNADGDKTLVHVDVEHHIYRDAKEAALVQLERRMDEGQFVPEKTADEIVGALTTVGYDLTWLI